MPSTASSTQPVGRPGDSWLALENAQQSALTIANEGILQYVLRKLLVSKSSERTRRVGTYAVNSAAAASAPQAPPRGHEDEEVGQPVVNILYQGALLKLLLDIPYYIELQRRMVDIFRYVSCHEKNFDTYSVILESLLIDTCSFFDSLCQTLIREKSLAGHAFKLESGIRDFQKKVKSSAEFNFKDY